MLINAMLIKKHVSGKEPINNLAKGFSTFSRSKETVDSYSCSLLS